MRLNRVNRKISINPATVFLGLSFLATFILFFVIRPSHPLIILVGIALLSISIGQAMMLYTTRRISIIIGSYICTLLMMNWLIGYELRNVLLLTSFIIVLIYLNKN
ncbi:MAG: hypothetical protein ACEQSA_04010 [Weeksellaceae bacterium]